ncbi:hypothetical protein PDE_02898 [Penicillium oxalicum 114-2]|uniref:Uncharacterized protein n=1 Tax=Penicillium oxalicum (strain 114-2 / CGMCC 5302) TaxID=933388 RepID=S8APU2_PENO1|nr:hypothetical protein PDE_02898 [Penicillium oxalicum 114-2]
MFNQGDRKDEDLSLVRLSVHPTPSVLESYCSSHPFPTSPSGCDRVSAPVEGATKRRGIIGRLLDRRSYVLHYGTRYWSVDRGQATDDRVPLHYRPLSPLSAKLRPFLLFAPTSSSVTSTVPFLLEISSLSFPPGKLLRLLGLSLPPPLPRPLISLSTLCAARNGSTVAPKRHPLAGHATRCSQPSQSIRGLDLIIIRSSHDRPSVPKRAAPLYPSLFSTILQDHSCPPLPLPPTRAFDSHCALRGAIHRSASRTTAFQTPISRTGYPAILTKHARSPRASRTGLVSFSTFRHGRIAEVADSSFLIARGTFVIECLESERQLDDAPPPVTHTNSFRVVDKTFLRPSSCESRVDICRGLRSLVCEPVLPPASTPTFVHYATLPFSIPIRSAGLAEDISDELPATRRLTGDESLSRSAFI